MAATHAISKVHQRSHHTVEGSYLHDHGVSKCLSTRLGADVVEHAVLVPLGLEDERQAALTFGVISPEPLRLRILKADQGKSLHT